PHAARRAGSLPAHRRRSSARFPVSIFSVPLSARGAPIAVCVRGIAFSTPRAARRARSLKVVAAELYSALSRASPQKILDEFNGRGGIFLHDPVPRIGDHGRLHIA